MKRRTLGGTVLAAVLSGLPLLLSCGGAPSGGGRGSGGNYTGGNGQEYVDDGGSAGGNWSGGEIPEGNVRAIAQGTYRADISCKSSDDPNYTADIKYEFTNDGLPYFEDENRSIETQLGVNEFQGENYHVVLNVSQYVEGDNAVVKVTEDFSLSPYRDFDEATVNQTITFSQGFDTNIVHCTSEGKAQGFDDGEVSDLSFSCEGDLYRAECRLNSDCGDDRWCFETSPQVYGCVGCRDNADCATGSSCDTTTHECL